MLLYSVTGVCFTGMSFTKSCVLLQKSDVYLIITLPLRQSDVKFEFSVLRTESQERTYWNIHEQAQTHAQTHTQTQNIKATSLEP